MCVFTLIGESRKAKPEPLTSGRGMKTLSSGGEEMDGETHAAGGWFRDMKEDRLKGSGKNPLRSV